MAKVPDPFEDLKDCYSENEEYSFNNGNVSLNQKSFYDASYGPLHEVCMDKLMSQSACETSKTHMLTFNESMALVTDKGKILKKRRLSLNESMTNEVLEAVANDPEEDGERPIVCILDGHAKAFETPAATHQEIIKPSLASYAFQDNVKYRYTYTIKSQCILNDALTQSLIRDPIGPYLKAAALNNLENAVKFDIGAYKPADEFSMPVTLRISKSRLFVSAQNEDEPVLLKEMPETPRVITDETNLLFLWENHGMMHYFRSVTHPELYIATKYEERVHLAKGEPSVIDFKIWDS